MSIQIMPNIEILIQPSAHYRMRYEAEKRDRNYLTGRMDTMVNPNDGTITILSTGSSRQSASQTTVYPKIRIYNPNKRFGKLLIVCVSKSPVSSTDHSYFLHPNKLIGENCKNGYAEINFGSDEYIIIDLKKICIQHVKKKDTFESLNTYINNHIDPFNNANESINNLQNIDLNQLRLCFQAVFYDTTFDCKNKIVDTTLPVVSSIISNNCQELIIEHISLARDTVLGGNKLIILIRKMSLNTKNIYARFYNLANTWSAQVNVSSFHYGSAIVIMIPPYIDINITEPVECNCQLVYIPNDNNNCFDEISDTLYSESFKFVYEPIIKVLKKRLSDDDIDEKYGCRNGSSSICSNSNCSNSSSYSSSSSSSSSKSSTISNSSGNSNSSSCSSSGSGTTSQSPVEYFSVHPKANKKVRGIWGLSEATKVASEKQPPANFTNSCFQNCCSQQTQNTLANSDDDTMQDSELIYTNHKSNKNNNNMNNRNYMHAANIMASNGNENQGNKSNEIHSLSFPLQNSISYDSLFNVNNANANYQIMFTDNNNNNHDSMIINKDDCIKQLNTSASATSINHNKYSPFQSLSSFQRLVINPATTTNSTSQNNYHHNNMIGFAANPNHPLILNTFCIPKPINKNNLL